jgi:hypothetical protein
VKEPAKPLTWAERRAKLARRISALEGRARIEPDKDKREALRAKAREACAVWNREFC